MKTKLLNYFSQKIIGDCGIDDIEYINGVVYILSRLNGVFGFNLRSNGEIPCFKNHLKAEKMQIFDDNLILIGEEGESLYERKAVFQILDTQTGNIKLKSVTLPKKNYSTKRAKLTFTGKEVIEDATETAPDFKKAIIVNDKLYILYQFNKEKAITKGKIIEYDMCEKNAILCVYSLPELELKNHYDLKASASKFCLRYPYIISADKHLLHSFDITTMQNRTAEIKNNPIQSITCDRDFIYVCHSSGSISESFLSIFKISDLSFIETIDLIKQMSGVNYTLKAMYNKILGNISSNNYIVDEYKKADDYFKQLYTHPLEAKGFIRSAHAQHESFACVTDVCCCFEHNILAMATELGSNPGFLWDIQKRQPITYLLGKQTVSRQIKVRYPYILSCATEDAHIWELSK